MKSRSNHSWPRSAITTATVVAATALALVVGATALPASALTPSATTATTETLWGTSAPKGAVADSDTGSVELGTTFTAKTAGKVMGVRYWKTAENRGTHTGTLWASNGTKLATATFSSETTSGWQTVKFSAPVTVKAGGRYVASYHAPSGRYATTVNLKTPALASTNLSVASGSGTYAYGTKSAFPTKSWNSSGYWVDVIFAPTTTTPTPAPTTTAKPAPAPVPAPSTAPAPTPTTAPTTTPTTPAPGAGTTFAGSANTGPKAAGFNPTQKYTGPMTITANGTVIKNQVIPAGLKIVADDVTVQGNIIAGPTDVGADQAAITIDGDRAKVVDNEIRGNSATDAKQDPASGMKASGDSMTFARNNMYWIAGDGISLYGTNLKTTGNWIHDFVYRAGVHYDGVLYPDATTSAGLIEDNTIELWVADGMTAAISFQDTAPKIVVNHNVIAGGGYAITGGGSGITFSNNLFWKKFSPNVGTWGIHSHMGTVNWVNNSYSTNGTSASGPLSF